MANFKTAWNAFWAILKDDDKARAWENLGAAAQPPAPPEPAPQEKAAADDNDAAAVHLLAILQREARLMDYLEEGLDGYDDASVGAVSRKVHDDCRRTIEKYFTVSPIMSETENSQVTVPAGFDANRIKISGNAVGEPPYTGTLPHKGWAAVSKGLPQRGKSYDASVVFPAEVEV
ncbi:MAG: DUF2760 domain-containing protein [Victivallales bacterium]|nr:DUF2760 domain-containing protein [Victivallales bacterium]